VLTFGTELLLLLTLLVPDLDVLLPLAEDTLATELLVILELEVEATLPLLLFATLPFKASLLTLVTLVEFNLAPLVATLPVLAAIISPLEAP